MWESRMAPSKAALLSGFSPMDPVVKKADDDRGDLLLGKTNTSGRADCGSSAMYRQSAFASLALLLLFPISSPSQSAANPDTLSLSMPGLDWSLAVTAPGLAIQFRDTLPAGRGVHLVAAGSAMMLSLQLEKSPTLTEGKGCQEHHLRDLQKMLPRMDDLRVSDSGAWAMTEFFVTRLLQKNVFVYGMRDGVCMMIHLSKAPFRPGEEKLFSTVLQTVRIHAASPQSSLAEEGVAFDYFKRGALLYRQGDYAGAISPWRTALAMEKQRRTLDEVWWRVLVDSLGIAYGITGHLKEAKETLEYGISQDPAYGFFYYNLACAYAEMEDVDNTIANLKMAFKYEHNLNPTETIPDPRVDPSFKRFLKNEKFLRALEDAGR